MIEMIAPLEYRVVYDARTDSVISWGVLWMGLAISTVGWVVRITGRKGEKRGGREFEVGRGEKWSAKDVRLFGTAIWMLAFLVTCLIAGTEYSGAARLRRALADGAYAEVEGIVTDFRATPSRESESWVVESGGARHRYEYSASELASGYQRTQREGGAIRNGIRVRIADVGGVIARLEIDD
jgi:hypothetical protein